MIRTNLPGKLRNGRIIDGVHFRRVHGVINAQDFSNTFANHGGKHFTLAEFTRHTKLLTIQPNISDFK